MEKNRWIREIEDGSYNAMKVQIQDLQKGLLSMAIDEVLL